MRPAAFGGQDTAENFSQLLSFSSTYLNILTATGQAGSSVQQAVGGSRVQQCVVGTPHSHASYRLYNTPTTTTLDLNAIRQPFYAAFLHLPALYLLLPHHIHLLLCIPACKHHGV